ncbi:hypothetical protein D3C73_1224080 [compost metagenome]
MRCKRAWLARLDRHLRMCLGKRLQGRKTRAYQQQALRGEALQQGRQGLLGCTLGKTVGHCQSSFRSSKTNGLSAVGKAPYDPVVAYCWQG